MCVNAAFRNTDCVSKPYCNNRIPWKMNSKLLQLFLMQLSFAYLIDFFEVFVKFVISHCSPSNIFPCARLI